jgi:hypothetical protein
LLGPEKFSAHPTRVQGISDSACFRERLGDRINFPTFVSRSARDALDFNKIPSNSAELLIVEMNNSCALYSVGTHYGVNRFRKKLQKQIVLTPKNIKPVVCENPFSAPIVVVYRVLSDRQAKNKDRRASRT